MKSIQIAQIAHAVNRTYRQCLEEEDTGSWESYPDERKQSVISGVESYLQNPTKTPEESHESWCDRYKEMGWIHNEDFDEEFKTHPNLVPYVDLPQDQHIKDHLFKAVVLSMSELTPEVVYQQAESVEETATGKYHAKGAEILLDAIVLKINGNGSVELLVRDIDGEEFEATSIPIVTHESSDRINQRYFIPDSK